MKPTEPPCGPNGGISRPFCRKQGYQRRGYLYVITAAVMWAISGSGAKFLFSSGISPFELVQLRLTIAAVALLVWLAGRHPDRLKIAPGDTLYFFLLGSGAMAAVQFTYLYAISRVNVAVAILLQYLAPAMIAVYAAVVSRERPGRVTLLSLAGAVAGCYLMVGAYNLKFLALNALGVVSGLLSAVSFAWYSLQGEYGMRRYHPWTVLFFAVLFAALTWNIALPPLKAFFRDYTAVQWAWILYIGLLGTLLPFGFYFKGINLIRATRASITATLEPMAAGMLSFLFLNEVLTLPQMAGGVMVIAAVILLQAKQEFDERAPDVLRGQKQPEAASRNGFL